MANKDATDKEIAEGMGISIERARALREHAEKTSRMIERGFQKQARDHREREHKLGALRAWGRVTPHPMVGKKRGPWSLSEINVSEDDEFRQRMQAIFQPVQRFVRQGKYTTLERDGVTVMTDTDDELLDLWDFTVKAAYSERILINGLGLGCAVKIALQFDNVKHIDVVEFSKDVIKLTSPLFDDPRLVIHQGDAYTYKFPPGMRWDIAWHDIWDEISADNDFATLHRRYGHRVEWQGSWARKVAVKVRRAQNREWADLQERIEQEEHAQQVRGYVEKARKAQQENEQMHDVQLEIPEEE